MSAQRWMIAALIGTIGLVALIFPPGSPIPSPVLVLRAEPQHRCLPWDWYYGWKPAGGPETVVPGDLVMLESRGLEPIIDDGAQLVKMVGAVAGTQVRIDSEGVWFDSHLWGKINHPSLRATPDEFVVPEGQVMLMGLTRESYDSRYYGPVPITNLDGKAAPMLVKYRDTKYSERYGPQITKNLLYVDRRRDAGVVGRRAGAAPTG